MILKRSPLPSFDIGDSVMHEGKVYTIDGFWNYPRPRMAVLIDDDKRRHNAYTSEITKCIRPVFVRTKLNR